MGTVILVLLYVALPALQAILYTAGLPFFDGPEVANYVAAIALYHWMAASVVVSARVPLLQSALPHDTKIRFHILGSAGILVALAYHTVYKLAAGKLVDWVSWSLLGVPLVLLLLAVLWIPVPGFRRFRRRVLSLRRAPAVELPYDILKAVHGYLFLGMAALMLVHLDRAEVFGLVGPLSTALYIGELGLAAALYLYGKIRWLLLPRLGLLEATATDGLRILRLEKPRGYRYRAGQFAFLRLDAPGLPPEDHPFSYLSAPQEPVLAFAVRDLGDYTTRLRGLGAGARARVAGSFGSFHPRGEEAVCLISSGIGSVPVVSLVKDMAARNDPREALCFIAVDRREQIPDLAGLARAAATVPNLDLRLLVRAEDGLQYGPAYLSASIPDPRRYRYYVCCSAAVREIVLGALCGMGVPRARIHHESFAFG